jgi:hypothetical protein
MQAYKKTSHRIRRLGDDADPLVARDHGICRQPACKVSFKTEIVSGHAHGERWRQENTTPQPQQHCDRAPRTPSTSCKRYLPNESA